MITKILETEVNEGPNLSEEPGDTFRRQRFREVRIAIVWHQRSPQKK